MKSKAFLVLILFGVPAISGCRDVRFHLVNGPMAATAPHAVLKGKYKGLRSGKMSVALADGEVCTGPWKAVGRTPASGAGANAAMSGTVETPAACVPATVRCQEGQPANAPAPADLASAWVAAWGRSFYEDKVLRARYLDEATLDGNRGTVLRVEVYWDPYWAGDSGGNALTGVAKDNQGNVYKVVPWE
jgi:hypothetical protein